MIFINFIYPFLDKIVANCKYVQNEIKKFSQETLLLFILRLLLQEKKILKKMMV